MMIFNPVNPLRFAATNKLPADGEKEPMTRGQRGWMGARREGDLVVEQLGPYVSAEDLKILLGQP